MSSSKLPERASLEYLKKLAKDRLQELRRADPRAKLATALLSVARDYGFPSWRALKAGLEEREARRVALFFTACAGDDVEALRSQLSRDASLIRASDPAAHHPGWSGLHAAAKAGCVNALRVLLEHHADPNVREAGDNTYPLHWAAARGHLETVRTLLDAGADVHGAGDAHAQEIIGWATVFAPTVEDPMRMDPSRGELVDLLVARGARHHVFSAIAVGDPDLVRSVVEENPDALDRRMSRFERGQTPLHCALSRRRYDILDVLIDLGADLEAKDGSGQTALAVAMLRGDREAMRRLDAAGAQPPAATPPPTFRTDMAALARSIKKGVPMIMVPDVARALDWYRSIGFEEIARYEDDGLVNFGMVSFGGAELMLNMHGTAGPRHDVSLWFYTDQVDELYQLLKSRQLAAVQGTLANRPDDHGGIEFEQDIEDMFYGVRQFGIRDLNGYQLYFEQALEPTRRD